MIAIVFLQCKTDLSYYQGYIVNENKRPIKNLKVYEKNDKENFSITDKKGYFKIDIIESNINRFLIIEKDNKIIDSIQVIGTQGGEKIKYSFVEGEKDTLFINLPK